MISPASITDDLNNENISTDGGLKLCYLSQKDLPAIKALCQESFPVQYPDTWYQEVVDGAFISFGYFYNDILTSLMICEIKQIKEYETEDRKLLSDHNGFALYILSLAVRSEFRRKGIAKNLLNYLMTDILKENSHINVVFLHALTHNYGAIKFYKKNGFKIHTTLRNYYLIDGIYYDGYTFACYVNGYNDFKWCLETMKIFTSWIFCPVRSLIKHVLM